MFKELIKKIGEKLTHNKIPYMIIGGQAVILYGEPRLTRDIDITLGIGNEHLSKILDIVNSLSLKVLPKDVEPFVQSTMVLPIIDEKTGIRIDFIFSFTPYEKKAISRARKVAFENTIKQEFLRCKKH